MGRNQVFDFWAKCPATIPTMLLLHESEDIDAITREILSHLPPCDGFHVLDLASGVGRFTGEFARTAAKVTAVDLMPHFIAENRKRHAHFTNIGYLAAHASDIEFKEATFDFVFSGSLLMYLEDEELASMARKLHRWLKPGGHLFFLESCAATRRKRDDTYYATYRTMGEYEQLMSPLFNSIRSGSLQTYIDLKADPFKCFWLYCKEESPGKPHFSQ